MMRVSGHGVALVAERLWRVAILTAAGAIGVTSQAEAAIYYWPDSDPGYYRGPGRRFRSGAKDPPPSGRKKDRGCREGSRPSRRGR